MSTVAQSAVTRKPWRESVPIERAALIYFLVSECLTVTKDLVSDLERHLHLNLNDIERYGIRSIPSEVENIMLSHECLQRFGPSALWKSQMFYSFVRSHCDCLDWSDKCCCDLETWRLDVRPTYRRGVLLPVAHRKGYFTDLMVYRDCSDTNPFPLRVNAEREAAA